MINIAVCDDDRLFLKLVEAHIQRFFETLHIDIHISLFDNSDSLWNQFIRETFHIAILDIIMPGQSGIELSRRIYKHTKNCVIAFLTASPDHALEGYGVNAVAYILKPPTANEMESLLARCLERYNETRPPFLLVRIGGIDRAIGLRTIIHLESRNKQVRIVCTDEDHIYSGKLSDLLHRLPSSFVQTHKSYAVNLEHVRAMTRESMFTDAVRIPISRQFHRVAAQRFRNFFEGRLD